LKGKKKKRPKTQEKGGKFIMKILINILIATGVRIVNFVTSKNLVVKSTMF
jgi:hypothetical protein